MTYPVDARVRAVELYGQLGSTALVGRRMGVAHSTVQLWLRQSGVALARHGGRRRGAGRKVEA